MAMNPSTGVRMMKRKSVNHWGVLMALFPQPILSARTLDCSCRMMHNYSKDSATTIQSSVSLQEMVTYCVRFG
jgi:hypothetical protein